MLDNLKMKNNYFTFCQSKYTNKQNVHCRRKCMQSNKIPVDSFPSTLYVYTYIHILSIK